jgi:hypothetical protein
MCQSGLCNECLRSNRVLAGINGVDGQDGLSVLSGSGVPSNTLGQEGQYYIDRVAPFNMYIKDAGAWVLLGRLQGLDGNGFLLQTKIRITAAQILTFNGNAGVDILPSLPIPYFYNPIELVVQRVLGANVYTAPPSQYFVVRHYASGFTYFQTSTLFLTNINAYDTFKLAPVPNTNYGLSNLTSPFYIGTPISTFPSPIRITTNAGSLTGGDMQLDVTITYTVQTI